MSYCTPVICVNWHTSSWSWLVPGHLQPQCWIGFACDTLYNIILCYINKHVCSVARRYSFTCAMSVHLTEKINSCYACFFLIFRVISQYTNHFDLSVLFDDYILRNGSYMFSNYELSWTVCDMEKQSHSMIYKGSYTHPCPNLNGV